MKKKNNVIYILLGIAVLIFLIIVIVIACKNIKVLKSQGSGSSGSIYSEKIEAVDLPEKKELKKIRLENSVQTDSLNGEKLYNCEIDGGAVTYKYFTETNKPGQSLSVKAKSENITEYELALPKGDNVEKVELNNNEFTFYNRMIYFAEDENSQIPEGIKQNTENGSTEIRYNGTGSEFVSAQSLYWYDKENSIAYTMEVLSRDYSKDKMLALAEEFINNGGK